MECETSDIKLLTIGMPIYNNEKTLGRAIESILSQSGINFQVILSDDGSTDNTWDICQRYSALDHRIMAIRQETNLYYNNFKFVLDAAQTP
jgi:glycosyltransferase involved in cell wall biosynthesis